MIVGEVRPVATRLGNSEEGWASPLVVPHFVAERLGPPSRNAGPWPWLTIWDTRWTHFRWKVGAPPVFKTTTTPFKLVLIARSSRPSRLKSAAVRYEAPLTG